MQTGVEFVPFEEDRLESRLLDCGGGENDGCLFSSRLAAADPLFPLFLPDLSHHLGHFPLVDLQNSPVGGDRPGHRLHGAVIRQGAGVPLFRWTVLVQAARVAVLPITRATDIATTFTATVAIVVVVVAVDFSVVAGMLLKIAGGRARQHFGALLLLNGPLFVRLSLVVH